MTWSGMASRVFVALVFLGAVSNASAQPCGGSGLVIQILGSGGPFVNPDRASTSYLVWVGDRGKVLVDAGGGAFLRFGQAQGRLADLSLIAISHLHPDHVSDLPALLWLSHFTRKQPLPILGPSGNDSAPSFPTFLSRLFDEKNGAFQVLGGLLRGSGFGVPLDVTVVNVASAEPSAVFEQQGITVSAMGVPHGSVPSVAYRVQASGASVVFGSDQNGADPKFVEFARNANLLVMHLTFGAGESSAGHASPEVVGRIARDSKVKRLVLSHIGQFDLDAALAEIRKSYAGPLTVGADLQCTPTP